jgi:DNA primase
MTTDFFEAVLLDDDAKESICRQLLSEFGVTHINRTAKGELIHSCCLPFGSHKNGDRNPSASLNFRKLTYNCLGCGSHGGLLWFIASCRGEDSAQAREWLEQQTGLGQTVMELPTLLKMIDEMYKPQVHRLPPIPRYDEAVLRPWTHEVFHPYLTDGLPEYGVQGRHIPEQTLRRFGIGYTDHYTDGSERIIIPQWWDGHLVGWQARHVDAAGKSDKYKNSPDFPREQTIYNYDPHQITALVVESPMSVLRHVHHMPEIMATFGAKVTDEQIRLLQVFPDVVLWYDNDTAGWHATHHIAQALAPYTTVWVVCSPYAADPADLPDDEVCRLLNAMEPYVVWSPPTTLIPWRDDDTAQDSPR